jgi:hypothetical protein
MPIPPNLLFTPDDVEAKAGVAPWDRQVEFHNEINIEDMATTATTYAKAAAEARNAQDLAVRASQISENPGGWEGAPLVDGEGRVIETSEGLQQGGAAIDQVTQQIGRAMATAQDTDESVTNLISGPDGLNDKFDDHIQRLIADWNALEGARDLAIQEWEIDQRNQQNQLGGPTYWPSVIYDSRTTELDRTSQGGNSYLFSIPESMVGEVRELHLKKAADTARGVHGEMEAQIERYRRNLTEQAGLLRGMGYEPSEGPFSLFTNKEMAEFAADKLDLELRDPALPPDPGIVDLYTQQLAEIRENAYEGPGKPHLTPEERDYLSSFYTAIEPETLAKLGQLGYADDPNNMANAQRATVADGISMLMNQDDGFGGISPQEAPASIRPFVYDYANSGLIPSTNPLGGFDGSQSEAWQRHNGFGDLMAATTVQSGGQFSKDLAHAAVDIENRSQMPLGEGYVPPANTGSSGMLHAASLNTLASAQVLNEEDFRHSLLNQSWDRGAGAGELIHSGTTPPTTDPTQVPRDYVEAAFNVLSDAPDYQGAILSPGADNVAVQGAIGDTALEYMDLISRSGTQGGSTGPLDWLIGPEQADERGMWAPSAEMTIHGKTFTEGFDISRQDREGLFALLNQSNEGVREDFFHGVAQWEAGTAYNAFEREGTLAPGQPPGETDTFRHIGTIAGTVAQVQGPGAVADLSNARVSGLGAVAASAAFVTGVLDSPGRVAGPVGLGAFGLGEAMRFAIPDPKTVADEAQWDALESGDIPVRSAVADAALAADYNGVAGIPNLQRPDGTAVPYTSANWTDFADRASGAYGHYSTTLENSFNEAMGT